MKGIKEDNNKKFDNTPYYGPFLTFCKLRSMSPRTLYVWKVVNGEIDSSCPLAVMKTGSNVIFSPTVTVDSYVYTSEPFLDNKEIEVIGSIKPRLDQERMYLLYDDENNPPPQELIKVTEAEVEFSKEYMEKSGYFWNHYFDENGPRKPPKMHLYAADYVGQKHFVTSAAGLWYFNYI